MAKMPLNVFHDILSKSRVMVISGILNGKTWSTPLYFVFERGFLYFFSSDSSRHVNFDLNEVSGSIFIDSKNLREIRGVQINGYLEVVKDILLIGKIYKLFLKKYPEAKDLLVKKGIKREIKLYRIVLKGAVITTNDPIFFKKFDITQIP